MLTPEQKAINAQKTAATQARVQEGLAAKKAVVPGASIVVTGATPAAPTYTGATVGGGVSINAPVAKATTPGSTIVSPPPQNNAAPPAAVVPPAAPPLPNTGTNPAFVSPANPTGSKEIDEAIKLAKAEFDKTGKFSKEMGFNNTPATYEEMLKQHNEEQARQKQYLDKQQASQNQLDTSALGQLKSAGETQKSAIDANYAVGREGVMSSSKPMAAQAFRESISQNITDAETRYQMAVTERDNAQANLANAQSNENTAMAAQFARQVAVAEDNIKKREMDMFNMKTAASQEQRAIEKQQNDNIANFKGMVDAGAVFTTADAVLDMAGAFNIPEGKQAAMLTYYKGMDTLRKTKGLPVEEFNLQKKKLDRELSDKLNGLDTDAGKGLRLMEYMTSKGLSAEMMGQVKDIMGLPDYSDPMTMAKLKTEQATAQIKAIEAKYAGQPPPYGTKDYWDIEKLKAEIGIANSGVDSLRGVETAESFDAWTKSFGGSAPTQDFHTSTIGKNGESYIKGRTEHEAIDIGGKEGSPITSPTSGTVVEVTTATSGSGWGNSAVIQDSQGNKWRMAHFQALNVNKGDTVGLGQQVGLLGHTGFTKGETGNHVHIETTDPNGKRVDPRSLFGKSTAGDMAYIMTSLPNELTKGKTVAERNSMAKQAQSLFSQYKDADTVVDIMSGYKINDKGEEVQSFATGLLQSANEFRAEGKLDGLARYINNGLYGDAINEVENRRISDVKADKEYKDNVAPGLLIEDILKAKALIEKNGADIMGKWDSKKDEFDAFFPFGAGKEEQKAAKELAAALTGLNIEKRNDISGTAVTKSEGDYLRGILPELSDQPDSAIQKLDVLADRILGKYNASRSSVGLPEIKPGDYYMLTNSDYRVGLYQEKGRKVMDHKNPPVPGIYSMPEYSGTGTSGGGKDVSRYVPKNN